jgi:ethanolamine utilization protein EutN
MYLGRVIGRVVASQRYEGLDGVPLQIVQPLDEQGASMGGSLIACSAISSGPGDLIHYVDGREAALALPNETFVPVDATITGFVEQAVVGETDLAKDPEPSR